MIGSWHLVTGEYPPQRGGVGDYTAMLARALSDVEHQVHVWAPPGDAGSASSPQVHRLPDVFRGDGLRMLDAELDACVAPRTVVIQYVPQAFGMRGMNVAFCRWARQRARRTGDDVRVMFHEPYYPFTPWPPHQNLLAITNRLMAVLLLSSARIAYVSTTAWISRLRRYAPRGLSFTWLPIPSSIPAAADRDGVVAVRRRLVPTGSMQLVGHFGTYGLLVASTIQRTFSALLHADPKVRVCLLGTGSDAAARALEAQDPVYSGRVFGMGYQTPQEVATHLQACDLVVQPYADGVSGRRTTLMAALSNGVAVVTNRGAGTEELWTQTEAVAFARDASPEEFSEAVRALLGATRRVARTSPPRGRVLL